MNDDIGFIIGNGETRVSLELSRLKGKGIIVGCNALYREFEPDFLVAIDPVMIEEIESSNFPKEKFVIPPAHEQYESQEYAPYGRRSNAGMNAMDLAIGRGCKTLYCIGFDFLLEDKQACMSNVYQDTPAYGPDTRCSHTDTYNRALYLDWFASKYSNIQFYFAFPRDINCKFKTLKSNNIKGTYLDQLPI
jgi:hypothetical protein